jgi:hypothetical protein
MAGMAPRGSNQLRPRPRIGILSLCCLHEPSLCLVQLRVCRNRRHVAGSKRTKQVWCVYCYNTQRPWMSIKGCREMAGWLAGWLSRGRLRGRCMYVCLFNYIIFRAPRKRLGLITLVARPALALFPTTNPVVVLVSCCCWLIKQEG